MIETFKSLYRKLIISIVIVIWNIVKGVRVLKD
jgi:hypothetical protein